MANCFSNIGRLIISWLKILTSPLLWPLFDTRANPTPELAPFNGCLKSGMGSWNIWRSGQTLLLPTRLLPLRKVSPLLGTVELCYAKRSHGHTCVIHFHGDIVYQVITSFRDCNFISVTPEHAINELSLVDANRIVIFITSCVWSDEVMNMNCISCNSRTEWAVHNKA